MSNEKRLSGEGKVLEVRNVESTIETVDGALYQARLLDPKDSGRFDKALPMEWWTPTDWLFRTIGMVDNRRVGPPQDSGAGFVTSPYAQWYTVIYGVLPIADLPKYRLIYRSRPEVKSAIDTQINMAIQKGFIIKHKVPEIAEYLNNLMNTIDAKEALEAGASDLLVYGNLFMEILWSDKDKIEEEAPISKPVYDELRASYADIVEKYVGVKDNQYVIKAQHIKRKKHDNVKPTIVGLKILDPLYMRVRRDAFGGVYGYIQWISFPPAVIDNDSMIHVKWGPKSWNYESAYGTSQLMPILKHVDLLNQFENDAGVWMHYRAIPPLIVKGGGDAEHPYSTDAMKDLIKKFARRTPATTVFIKSDVEVDEIKGAASNLNVKWWIEYLTTRVLMAIETPPMLVGVGMAGSMRGMSEILFNAFLGRLTHIQERLGSAMVQQVLIPLIKERFGESVIVEYGPPEFHWNPIVEEDRNQRQKRVIQTVVGGMLTPNEGRLECGYDKLQDPEMDKIRYTDPEKLAMLQIQAKMMMPGGGAGAVGGGVGKPGGEKKPSSDTKAPTGEKSQHPKGQQVGLGGIAKKNPTTAKMPLELNREDTHQPSQFDEDARRMFPELRGPLLPTVLKSSLDRIIDNINHDDFNAKLRGVIDAALLELGAGDVLVKEVKARALGSAKELFASYFNQPQDVESSLREFEAIINSLVEEHA